MASSIGEPLDDLDARVAAWRAREAAFLERVEPDFAGLTAANVAPDPLAPGEREAWNWALPWETLRREGIGALISRVGRGQLAASGVDLERSPWGTSRCWPEARRRLRLARAVRWPSELLAQLENPARAEAFLADCADPLAFGVHLGRYAERLAELAHLAPSGPALDVGSATGEGAWELAVTLRGADLVIGTDACPLLVQLAEAQRVPHAPERERALERFVRRSDLRPGAVRFVVADVRLPTPDPGQFGLIACHGVLGESVRQPVDLDAALGNLARSLLPGGVLSLANRFREDRSATLAAAIQRAVERHGLERLGPDLLRRPRSS